MTKDDITKIDQLLQKRLRENNLRLRQELKNDIKAEVDPLHERLDAQREQIADVEGKITGVEKRLTGVEQKITGVEQNLSAQLSRETNDITELIRDIIIPKLEQHDEQIAQLQQEADIKPHRH